MDIRRINDQFSVSPQIALADIDAIRSAGFVAVINNRPDGEETGQPQADDIEAAVRGAGLAYRAIPLGREGVTPAHVETTKEFLDSIDGPVLAFCRSGTRSTTLWALSQSGQRPADEIIAAAAGAGYDIAHLSGHLAA